MLDFTNRRALLSAFLLACVALPVAGMAQTTPSAVGANRVNSKTSLRRIAEAKPAATAGDGAVQALIERYEVDSRALEQFYNINFAADRLDRLEQLTQTTQAQLKAIDFNALSQTGRVDYTLLHNYLDHETRQMSHQQTRDKETSAVLPFAPTIISLEERRWKVTPLDPEKTAKLLTELAQTIKAAHARALAGFADTPAKPAGAKTISASANAPAAEIKPDSTAVGAKSDANPDANPTVKSSAKTNVKPGLKISPVVANRAGRVAQELRRTLNVWFAHYDSFRPDFAWWCRKPYEAAGKELDEYAADLRTKLSGMRPGDDSVLLGDPIGRAALLDDLKSEMIAYTPEELIAIAEKEMAWCEEQMRQAAKQMGQTDWKAALAIVKEQHVPAGEQDQFVAQQARSAVEFLDQHNLVTIDPLCRETWRVQMIGADEQKMFPFAAYGGQKVLVAYPTDQMDYDTKLMSMRGNNKAFTHIVTPHELIPGHHLQGYMAQRNRPYRELFRTPFLVEGWSLYWEMRLWDLNYSTTPEDKIGMLFWRMHRCARIIVSLKFHLGQMTPQQMIDYLVDRVGHERDGATGEVRRFIGGAYSPLYQVAYMIGGKQLYALHKELVETGKMTERDFHDAVLRENSIPVDMIRASLANTPLTPDYKTEWKFEKPF